MMSRADCSPKLPKGFTLLELLVVIAIIAILAGLLLPVIANGKSKAHVVQCASNLHQLGLALSMYEQDSQGEFPPRKNPTWLVLLKPYYVEDKVLQCPTGARTGKNTYVINAFNDWFKATLQPLDFLDYMDYKWPHGFRPANILHPSETITFGELRPESGQVHMDLFQGQGNDWEHIDQSRHDRGSNYAFADGSIRLVGRWKTLSPINLWAIMPEWRVDAKP